MTLPATTADAEPLLSVRDLNVTFRSSSGAVPAVRGLSFDIAPGEIFAVVGESGSGKSTMVQAVMGLSPPSADIAGEVRLNGRRIDDLPRRERRRLSGEGMALVSQDALAGLNPCTSVGFQIAEMLMVHRGVARGAAMAEAARLMTLTGIPSAKDQLQRYPHQFSGGMRQRVYIAMSLALNPDLLIADEPTTALDATIKAQNVDLLMRFRHELGMSILIVTHDMGVVARMADRMLVMYAGQGVEGGPVAEVFADPAFPYTRALLEAMPRLDAANEELAAIPGAPPSPQHLPPGCPFHPRCPSAQAVCAVTEIAPRSLGPGRFSACHFAADEPAARIAL